MPLPNASGTAPNSAARVVIRIGRKRCSQARLIASAPSSPWSRSSSSAKSIIMIAFFMTMPTSSTTPMVPITSNWLPLSISAASAPSTAEGKVDRIVSGWMKLS